MPNDQSEDRKKNPPSTLSKNADVPLQPNLKENDLPQSPTYHPSMHLYNPKLDAVNQANNTFSAPPRQMSGNKKKRTEEPNTPLPKWKWVTRAEKTDVPTLSRLIRTLVEDINGGLAVDFTVINHYNKMAMDLNYNDIAAFLLDSETNKIDSIRPFSGYLEYSNKFRPRSGCYPDSIVVNLDLIGKISNDKDGYAIFKEACSMLKEFYEATIPSYRSLSSIVSSFNNEQINNEQINGALSS